MGLLIDVGNTQLKWLYGDSLSPIMGSFSSEVVDGSQLIKLKSQIGVPEFVALACVKSPVYEGELVAVLREVFGLEPFVASVARRASGMVCSYEDPSRMGIDRWLAMIAVRSLVDGVFCVVDCGSAITIDWVESSGCHQGGFILPGIRLSLSALMQGTDQVIVDSDQLSSASLEPGVSTTQAVYNGALFSLMSQVVAAYEKMQEMAVSEKCTLILTGGDAKLLSPKLNIPHRLIDGLVFKGLDVAYKASGEV